MVNRKPKLSNLEENKLILEYQNGSIKSFNILYQKYEHLSKKIAKSWYFLTRLPCTTEDDFFMLCIESFYFAIRTYIPDDENVFYLYWRTVYKHEIGGYLRETRKVMKNSAMSLDQCIDIDGNTFSEILSNYEDKYNIDSDKLLLSLSEEDNGILNDEQKEIFRLKIFGYNLSQIAEKLSKEIKDVKYLYYRGLNKIKKKFMLDM